MRTLFEGQKSLCFFLKGISISEQENNKLIEGSYLPSNRNSPKSERIENAPLAILISTEQF